MTTKINSQPTYTELMVNDVPAARFTEQGIAFDNTGTGLTATNVQDAVSELTNPNNSGTKKALNASGNAPIYACRAWVNFNGETQEIYGSGNVSSITKASGGDYTVAFITQMPIATYAWSGNSYSNGADGASSVVSVYQRTTAAIRVVLSRNDPSVTSQTTQGSNDISVLVIC